MTSGHLPTINKRVARISTIVNSPIKSRPLTNYKWESNTDQQFPNYSIAIKLLTDYEWETSVLFMIIQ